MKKIVLQCFRTVLSANIWLQLEPESKLWSKSEPEPKINNLGFAKLFYIKTSFTIYLKCVVGHIFQVPILLFYRLSRSLTNESLNCFYDSRVRLRDLKREKNPRADQKMINTGSTIFIVPKNISSSSSSSSSSSKRCSSKAKRKTRIRGPE